MKAPIIGVSAWPHAESQNWMIRRTYLDSVAGGGGLPLVIPLDLSMETLRAIYARVDGLLFTGGVDVDPAHYGQQPSEHLGHVHHLRDRDELALARWALEDGKPIMAICRGIQLVNVAAGGTLIQDIPSERPEALNHHHVRPPTEGAHPVTIEPDSLLAEILESKRTVIVNTSHHQAVEDPAPGWRVTARAPDGIIEAVEPSRDAHPFALCVQWHPEAMLPSYGQGVLFDAFCRAAAQTGN